MKDKHVLVIGSGSSIKSHKKKIVKLVKDQKLVTFGINYMTSLCYPEYHLWTNKQRYRDLGSCIDENSNFLFGCGITKKLIRKHYAGDYETIDYTSNLKEGAKEVDYYYEDGKYYGYFRTAGVLAIMIAYHMGAKKISIVGMDGYTLHSRKQLLKGKKSHHCYGKGYTDDASWEKCKKKDAEIYSTLEDLYASGIEFEIITPTKFKDFYNPSALK